METNYYEPDPIFSLEGIYSKEEFIKTYLVKADFGPSIPKDVLESYKTAEYLMAHAYYHYPMYDEAFWKVLGIYEMAIKFRCKELGIELLKIGREGNKDQSKNLGVLHDELIKNLKLDSFKYTFDWIIKLRNEQAHPNKHSFGGTLYKMHIEMVEKFFKKIFEKQK
jgi:hypothetical protein